MEKTENRIGYKVNQKWPFSGFQNQVGLEPTVVNVGTKIQPTYHYDWKWEI